MMPSLKNQNLFILFLWLCCHIPLLTMAQQMNPDHNVSISAVSEPISQVLDKVSRNTGVTFSYNPDHIDASRLISINLKDKTLAEALTAILPADKFGFRFTGKQVVIFRKSVSSEQPLSQPVLTETSGSGNTGNPLPDTVFITRTTIQRDTIALRDTILKFDTVYMMRTVVRDNPITGKEIFSNQTNLSKDQTQTLKFEPGFSIAWMGINPVFNASQQYFDKLEEYRNSVSGSQISGSFGIDLKLSYARFSFGTGLSYSTFTGKLDYNYEISTGGFFLKDTLDIYYTLIDTDTTWFYVLDSSYIPVNLEAYGYKTSVKHRYFEIPVYFQYSHPSGRNLVYLRAGLIAGIHAGSEGLMILPDEKGVMEINKADFKPLVFSFTIGAGMLIPLNGRFAFDGGFNYRQHLSSVFSDFPIEAGYRSFGVRAGVVYKF
ncbi:MAG: hypothetical protein V1775_13225 [Bacteroidota bacterium]